MQIKGVRSISSFQCRLLQQSQDCGREHSVGPECPSLLCALPPSPDSFPQMLLRRREAFSVYSGPGDPSLLWTQPNCLWVPSQVILFCFVVSLVVDFHYQWKMKCLRMKALVNLPFQSTFYIDSWFFSPGFTLGSFLASQMARGSFGTFQKNSPSFSLSGPCCVCLWPSEQTQPRFWAKTRHHSLPRLILNLEWFFGLERK